MYEPLLHVIGVEMLADEDDFEIDTGLRDGLQGLKQGDPVLGGERKLKARKDKDLRKKAGRWTLVPRATCCYNNKSCHLQP